MVDSERNGMENNFLLICFLIALMISEIKKKRIEITINIMLKNEKSK